ncbi:MAG TPA: hypothetical protein VJ257_03995 [Solirubrobacterales bacterium]|nr:hypothetical protein [Solirubrobacterales bacterium]
MSAAVDPYRTRLADDSRDFTVALLALAKSNVKSPGSFNHPSPQDAVALHALAHWRRDAQHALHRVRAVASDAPGRNLAEKWLKAMIAALDLQRQGLSLIDPNLAADAGGLARKRIAESHRLEERLDRVLA